MPAKPWTPVTARDVRGWPAFRANAHTQGIVNGELVYVWRKVKKKQNRRADGTRYPSVVWSSHGCWQREEQRVRVLSRPRDGSCIRMFWKGKPTTKEKALFESALDKENLSWEEPLLDESVEFPDTEMRDTLVGSPNLEEEIKSPVNEDGDLNVSEPPASENEDHNEYGTQVTEPDLVTDESPEVERDQLRRRLTSKQPLECRVWARAFSRKGGKNGIELKKRARVNVSELLHCVSRESRSIQREAMAQPERS